MSRRKRKKYVVATGGMSYGRVCPIKVISTHRKFSVAKREQEKHQSSEGKDIFFGTGVNIFCRGVLVAS
ncbi:hypothetical protein KJ786_01975 [Patescibacteria group bacterium]|nr:hypothetical protein [Patescibacteria group bacterium]